MNAPNVFTAQPLAGQTALVTGATRGIGRCVALSLASAGASVAIHGRSVTSAQERLTYGLFDELFTKSAPTLGEAILRAKQSMSAQASDEREVIETFVLLGDPALKFERPK